MPYDPKLAVRFAAFGVSGQAIANTLTQADVDDLLGRTEEALNSDDPLFRAITRFATQYPLVRQDPEQLADLGTLLRFGVDEANNAGIPEDDWARRKDING
ncbi:hypothetical protein KX928_23230 [Roseobacter sp. YSTF-M11]|uniref:Uncharacterized protein n=1 Tax=Roseobacter insulae TaxID=2859783 RepID=A0A9X1K4L0_9RHOB|nr:hypothetical protein [Roseobacter insulae]MBW4710713.1 hypothetical protein [Roseobacter insulae]